MALPRATDPMLITTGMHHTATVSPRRLAVQAPGGALTYAELAGRATSIAHGLRRSLGEAVEAPIGLLASDPLAFLPAFLGIVLAGGQATPLSPAWTSDELATAQDVCGLAAVVSTASERRSESWLELDELAASPDPTPLPERAPADIFYAGFTSGSSGTPRAFARDHAAWIRSFEAMSREFGIPERSAAVVSGSLFFSFPLIAVLHTLATGGTVHLPASPGARDVRAALPDEPCTLYALPSVVDQAARRSSGRGAGGVERIVCGGEPLRPESVRRVAAAFPDASLFEFYGASEFGFATVQDGAGREAVPASVGRAFAGVELATGASGELYVRNGYGPVFEYVDGAPIPLPEWRTAHDLASIDAEGFVHLTGRGDSMVVIHGENVQLEHIERVAEAVAGVPRAAALAWPPEAPTHTLLLVERGAEDSDAQQVVARCAEQLSGAHRPRRCIFVDELPLNPSGKLDRPALPRLVTPASR